MANQADEQTRIVITLSSASQLEIQVFKPSGSSLPVVFTRDNKKVMAEAVKQFNKLMGETLSKIELRVFERGDFYTNQVYTSRNDAVLDEAVKRFAELLREESPSLDPNWLENRLKSIGELLNQAIWLGQTTKSAKMDALDYVRQQMEEAKGENSTSHVQLRFQLDEKGKRWSNLPWEYMCYIQNDNRKQWAWGSRKDVVFSRLVGEMVSGPPESQQPPAPNDSLTILVMNLLANDTGQPSNSSPTSEREGKGDETGECKYEKIDGRFDVWLEADVYNGPNSQLDEIIYPEGKPSGGGLSDDEKKKQVALHQQRVTQLNTDVKVCNKRYKGKITPDEFVAQQLTECHILHMICRVGRNKENKVEIRASADGTTRDCPASDLYSVFSESSITKPAIVVLDFPHNDNENCYDTSCANEIAEELAKEGIKHVIALHYPKGTMGLESRFCSYFYGRLLSGRPISLAVQEARSYVATACLAPLNQYFGTIVYYSSAHDDGVLFKFKFDDTSVSSDTKEDQSQGGSATPGGPQSQDAGTNIGLPNPDADKAGEALLPPSPLQIASWQRQLAIYRDNLRLIEERKAIYVLTTDVPMQLVREESEVRAKIADLEAKLQGC
jgi:hypothetical protein